MKSCAPQRQPIYICQSRSVESSSYLDPGLTTNKTYYYQVRSFASTEAGNIYSSAAAVVYARPLPATPASFAAKSASYSSNKLNWAAVAGATGYDIYCAASSAGPFVQICTAGATSTSYYDRSLTTGLMYYYKIRACRLVDGAKIAGAYSAIMSAKPVPSIPGSFTVARYSSTSIRTSWAAVSGANGYLVYRATSATGTYSLVRTTTSTSIINGGLINGRTYYYKVRAFRLVGTTRIYGALTAGKYARPS